MSSLQPPSCFRQRTHTCGAWCTCSLRCEGTANVWGKSAGSAVVVETARSHSSSTKYDSTARCATPW